MARILAIGGAHIDYKGWLDAPHKSGASNPGHWQTEAGGGTFNAARNLARLGHHVTLVSPRGGDAAAEQVARAAQDAGLEDCPLTFLDRATPSYTAILEPDGNLVTALADMKLYDQLPARRLLSSRLLARLARADLIVTDANLPQDALTGLAEAAALTGIPATSTSELHAALSGLGLPSGLISAGAGPVLAFTKQDAATLVPPPLDQIRDVTGAGDALLSGYLDGWLSKGTTADNLSRGIALARLTTQTLGPVHSGLSPEQLNPDLT